MIKVNIGGVPEHFNWPWLETLREARAAGIEAAWRDYPGGSGAMGEALDAGELDVAMLLTEGAVAGIAKGGRYRILSAYTRSPLIWGIHVPAQAAELNYVEDIRGARYAISRYGSGSHLMSYAHARARAWPTDALEFVVVGDLAGAVRAFAERRAEVFLWEKFMTKPLVESGQFRRVGEFVAPWPAFVVCVADDAWKTRGDAIVELVERALERALAVASDPHSARRIAERYGLAREDVVEWLGTTRWAGRIETDPEALDEVLRVLGALELVPGGVTSEGLLVPRQGPSDAARAEPVP